MKDNLIVLVEFENQNHLKLFQIILLNNELYKSYGTPHYYQLTNDPLKFIFHSEIDSNSPIEILAIKHFKEQEVDNLIDLCDQYDVKYEMHYIDTHFTNKEDYEILSPEAVPEYSFDNKTLYPIKYF